jgi:hypothetical protein
LKVRSDVTGTPQDIGNGGGGHPRGFGHVVNGRAAVFSRGSVFDAHAYKDGVKRG